MLKRKSHNKSRNGCKACRARHIKCDEQGPPCANCKIRETDCEYANPPQQQQQQQPLQYDDPAFSVPFGWGDDQYLPEGTGPFRHQVVFNFNDPLDRRAPPFIDPSAPFQRKTVPPRRLNPALTFAPSVWLPNNNSLQGGPSTPDVDDKFLELELMHRWTLRTWEGIAMVPECRFFLQEFIPRAGLQYQFILNSIMALSALDIALFSQQGSTGGPESRYGRVALSYCTRASAEYRSAMSTVRLSRQNLQLFSQFGVLVGFFNLAFPSTEADMLTRAHACFTMLAGSATMAILNPEWAVNNETSATAMLTKYAPSLEFMEYIDPVTRAAVERISAVNRMVRIPPTGDPAQDTPDGLGPFAVDYTPYKLAAGATKYCFGEDTQGRVRAAFTHVATSGGKLFADAIGKREPFAIFVLMYWGVLVHRQRDDSRLWWIQWSGRGVVEEASDFVMTTHLALIEDVREAVKWARRDVGLDSRSLGLEDDWSSGGGGGTTEAGTSVLA